MLASPPGSLYRARKFLRRHRLAALGTAAALALILLSGVTVWSLMRRDSPAEVDRQRHHCSGRISPIATGDPAFDDTLRQGMAVELDKSPYLNVISDTRVSETLRLMVRPADTKLAPMCVRNLRADGKRGGGGGLDRKPRKRVRVELARQELSNRRCSGRRTGDGGEEGRRLQGAGPNGEPIQDPGGRIASTRRKASPTPLGRSNDAFTGGLKAFSAAMKAQQRIRRRGSHSTPEARRRNRPAIRDGLRLTWAGNMRSSGSPNWERRIRPGPRQLRNRVSDQENYFITFNYHRQVTRNLEMARQTLESWVPRVSPPGAHAARIFGGLRDAGIGPLRKSRGRRSKGDRTRSRLLHRLRKCCFCVHLPEPLPEAEAILQ